MDEYYCVSSAYPCHPCGYRLALRTILLRMDAKKEKWGGADLAIVIDDWEKLYADIEEEIRSLLPER